MSEPKMNCPECETTPDALDRRSFLHAAAGTAVTLVGLHAVPKMPRARADGPQDRKSVV